MTRQARTRLRRCVSAFSALLTVVTVGALQPAPTYATTTTTFTNPAAIQGKGAFGTGASSAQVTVSATGTPSGSVYPSTVHISGASGSITGVVIEMNLQHTAPDDLDLLLVSPAGKTVVLMSDALGYADFDGGLGFGSYSMTSLPDATTVPPAGATLYAATNYVGNDVAGDVWPAPAPAVADPNAPLSSLHGDSPNGDWKLFVHDDQDQDGGVIAAGWTLSITTDALPTPAATYPSALAVSGLSGAVTDVDLTLHGFSWENSSSLDLMLVAPDGRRALVMSDAGAYQSMTDVTLTLDDEASVPLSVDTAPTSGGYRPANFGGGDSFPAPAPDASTAGSPLSVFDGGNPNGTWTLYVVKDDPFGQAGLLSAGWSLQITTAPVSPLITSTNPASHATGVRRSATIRATVSEALRPGTVTGKSVYLTRAGSSRHIAATISYVDSSHTIVINPKRRLKSGTKYRAVVTADVRDTAGAQLDQDPSTAGPQRKTWKFRTR